MQTMSFRGWVLEVDPDATRRAYAALPSGSPEVCGCLECRNFVAARPSVYPAEARELYAQLGIDPAKEAEIYRKVELESGLHSYGGWHHLIGRILTDPGGIVTITDHFVLYLSDRPALVPNSFRGQPIVQVEFLAEVAWALEEKPL